MHFHAMHRWGATCTMPRSSTRALRHKPLKANVPIEASHPLVEYDADGSPDIRTIITAITNTCFDKTTGYVVAIGPDGLKTMVRIHNAQMGSKHIDHNIYGHLQNKRLFRNRKPLPQLQKLTTTSRNAGLHDETKTCIACNKFTAHPKTLTTIPPRKHVLCPACYTERTTMGAKGLVTIAIMLSCFSRHPLMTRMIRVLSKVTRTGVIGIAAGSTHRGLLRQLQPIGAMAAEVQRRSTKLKIIRRTTASLDYYRSLYPMPTQGGRATADDHNRRLTAHLKFAQRLTKKAEGHNRHPLALLRLNHKLSSTGRATFPPDVDRVWGKQGDLCTGLTSQTATLDTHTAAYVTFRKPTETTVCAASVACMGVIRTLLAYKIAISVALHPASIDQDEPDSIDATQTAGFQKDVHSGTVTFTRGECITYEHLWHCIRRLSGVKKIIIIGSLEDAINSDAPVTSQSLTAWKHGGTFHELATVPFHNLTVATHRLAWDRYDTVNDQKIARESSKRHAALTLTPFKHTDNITLPDIALVAVRMAKII